MMTKGRKTALISLLVLAASCSKTPSGVIPQDKMASIMADVHVGEAVVEMNRADYYGDSMKQVMKQSIFHKYGVTSEEVDSSLAWYGRNIERYMEVYDKTIEMLEHRIIESGNRIAAENALSIAGDSVDIWPSARYIPFNDRLPSDIFTFSFGRDPNWQRGDVYTWRAKFFNVGEQSTWLIGADYSDGSTEYMHAKIGGNGWQEIKFQTDSVRDAVRIYGYFDGELPAGADLRIDSLEMVRKRINPSQYWHTFTARYAAFNDSVKIEDFVAPEKTDDEKAANEQN